ncbi:Disease resistance protein [Thalictrum thalictroides]|uniref:Disease resistance protein n=1 Tax=Thalictrum thalictroides TaxID=46969 RepID=A0A7J6W7V5_THATH|nr:Disease resistance protein [Thalictrum thalictroides]
MDFVSPIIDIVSRLMNCCTKHVNYIRALEENLNQLKEEMDELNAVYMDVKNKVNVAEAQLMERTNQVNEWLQRVEARRLEVGGIIHEGTQHLETRCLNGCCPKNCWSSYKLGKMVVEKLILVEKLKLEGELENSVDLVSVYKALKFLGENSVRIMGLYGMGGVGKTTVMKRIYNEFNKDFDIVIWVLISDEVNMARVQEDIGRKLGLSLSNANNIFNVLKTKKYLLLVDDIWQRIDLQSIGVPSPSFHNKSKIVFTTRSEVVCRHMEADKIIRIGSLSWEASWTLFQKNVGRNVLSSDSDIRRLAEEVAKECRGLPLALITIGRSMANKKTRHEWEHAISVLKNSAAEFPGMGDDVLPLLKFSYDYLPNDCVRLCFLFCSLYPEYFEIEIEKLIIQWIGEGYISGYDNFKEAFHMGHDIIGILKGACLLEEGVGHGYVKMRDDIRDLSLWIACECGREKNKYFVKADVGLIETPQTGEWSLIAEKISYFANKITQLEIAPKCPNLLTLLVSNNIELEQIHKDFFLNMPRLRFLDLSNTAITKVPSSICELFEIEFLDISNTNIRCLPYEMRNLTKLKYLFITRCKIPHGIIMNLSNLEFLKLAVIKTWDSEGGFNIDELLYLKQLKSLEIDFYSDSKDVEKFLSYPQLANCARKLRVIDCNDITSLALSASSSASSDLCLGPLKGLEYLGIHHCSEIEELKLNCINKETTEFEGLNESLEKLYLGNLPKLICSWDARNLHLNAHFRNLHFLQLFMCHAMVDLTWLVLIPNLQKLCIQYCGLQEILSSCEEFEGGYDENTFSNLKILRLYYLPNLQSICSMSALRFPSLEVIDVRSCPKLRRLPLDSNSANNTLGKIRGTKEWWNRLEWDNETIKLHLVKFFKEGKKD